MSTPITKESPAAPPNEGHGHTPTSPAAGGLPTVDVVEYGGKKKDGERQAMNRRLFMQLLVLDAPPGQSGDAVSALVAGLLRERKIPGVVYADAMDPRGVGLLTWSDDPAHFVRNVRPLFATPAIVSAPIRTGWAMIGRTYGQGHEPDLEHVLLRRPVDNVMNEALPWHVWYPLRRTGEFAKLPPTEQGPILREHATIGMAYGQQELAHDIRLACHGMDAGGQRVRHRARRQGLAPALALVQTMRKTRQTSEFIAKMGPFFIGYVAHRNAG